MVICLPVYLCLYFISLSLYIWLKHFVSIWPCYLPIPQSLIPPGVASREGLTPADIPAQRHAGLLPGVLPGRPVACLGLRRRHNLHPPHPCRGRCLAEASVRSKAKLFRLGDII